MSSNSKRCSLESPGPGIVDVGQNGVGVAPLPLEQRTQTGTFTVKRSRLAPTGARRRIDTGYFALKPGSIGTDVIGE